MGMGPNGIGKRFGVGVRIGANLLRSRAGRAAQAAAQLAQRPAPDYAGRRRAQWRALGRGGRRFGESVWQPFAHAGSVLWLEITGLFFALFTLFFAQNVYRLRQSYKGGPQHQRFLLYVALTVVFLYFTFSSFYRARKKERSKPSRGK